MRQLRKLGISGMNPYRRLFADIVQSVGWSLPILLILMAAVGFAEGLSIALLLPLLGQIGVAAEASQGAALDLMTRMLALVTSSIQPGTILAVVIAVALLQAALFIGLSWWTVWLARRYQSQKQAQLLHAFMRARWTFLVDRKSGDLTSSIVTDTERAGQAFYVLLYLLAASIIALIYLAIALFVSRSITLALIAFAVLVTLSVSQMYRKSFAVGRTIPPLNAELQTVLGEQFAGIKVIKVAGQEAASELAGVGLFRRLAKAGVMVNFLPTAVRGLFEFLGFVFLATVFVFGKEWLDVAPGNIIVVIALFIRLFPRMTTVQVYLHSLNAFLHSVGVINELMTTAKAHAEPQDGSHDRLDIALPTKLVVKGLEVDLGGKRVLDGVDLSFALPGVLGVVGGSGGGKSTLIHAILGLVAASAGTMSLGPHTFGSVSLSGWRRSMGYVPQETMLFHTSVRANLVLGKPDATDAEIESAVRRAHAYDFIAALPQGYDTVIGDQGVRLSGGQRQRLGIARALLTNPVLLLMDEAMSALDAESEAEILAALDELRTKMGIILVAHRLAAVRNADAVCVLEAGRVVEFGSWDQLMEQRSRLHELVGAQNVS